MAPVKLSTLGVLMTTVTALPAAAQVEVTIGGYNSQWFGFGNEDNSEPIYDPERHEIHFRGETTLDNGLTFGGRVDLDDLESDPIEDFVFIRGSFGTIVIGEDDTYSGSNYAPVPDGVFDNYAPCGFRPRNDEKISYFTPRFAGFQIGVSYIGDISERDRGAMATDDGISTVINPAFSFGTKLEGVRYDASVGFCLDTGQLLPTTLSLGYYNSQIDGSSSVSNLNFPNGLGQTSPGGITGIYVNAPTDVQWGNYQADRDTQGVNLTFDHPVQYTVATGESPSAPSVTVFSLIGSVDYGQIDQDESVQIQANSPAFFPNSNWNADSATQFDSNAIGVKVGFANTHYIGKPGGITETLRIAGTVGYSYHDISVTDTTRANGLGGLVNFNNTQRNSYDDGVVTGSFNASYSLSKRNWTWTISAGVDYGSYPSFDYVRTDNIGGTPVPPSLDVKAEPVFTIGTGFNLSF